MKKFVIQMILLLIVITATFVLFSPTGQSKRIELPFLPQSPTFNTLEVNGNKLKVEVADTEAKRNKGLSGRNSIATDSGMLFIYPSSGKHVFWMKGMKFPLDFVWIKEDKVVDLIPGVPQPAQGQKDADLPLYTSKSDADKILEINVGGIQQLNIKVGDTIKISP